MGHWWDLPGSFNCRLGCSGGWASESTWNTWNNMKKARESREASELYNCINSVPNCWFFLVDLVAFSMNWPVALQNSSEREQLLFAGTTGGRGRRGRGSSSCVMQLSRSRRWKMKKRGVELQMGPHRASGRWKTSCKWVFYGDLYNGIL